MFLNSGQKLDNLTILSVMNTDKTNNVFRTIL